MTIHARDFTKTMVFLACCVSPAHASTHGVGISPDPNSSSFNNKAVPDPTASSSNNKAAAEPQVQRPGNTSSAPKTISIVEVLLLATAILSGFFAWQGAAASKQSASAAKRAVEASTGRSLEIVGQSINQAFTSGFPTDKDHTIRFYNTGHEVLHISFVRFQPDTERALAANLCSVRLEPDLDLGATPANIPIRPGHVATVIVRFVFNRQVLGTAKTCEGKLCFDVRPPLDTGESSFEIHCHFRSA